MAAWPAISVATFSTPAPPKRPWRHESRRIQDQSYWPLFWERIEQRRRHFATLAGSRAFYSRQTPYERDCQWNSFRPKYMRNLRYFVVTHCHRHGATTGLIIGEERQKKPSEADVVKLLKLNFEPDREEFIHVTEE